MRFYKITIDDEELHYQNLKLLCVAHGLSYRSAGDKIKRQLLPYIKDNMIVTELKMRNNANKLEWSNRDE